MPIRIRDSADPLSDRALQGNREVILARSEAGRLLRYELLRYCSGQIQGRSFLIAGHRGAGKTTMVADALNHAIVNHTAGSLRPLPIFLHGPSLLETFPSDWRALSPENGNGASNGKTKVNGSSTSNDLHLSARESASDPPANDASPERLTVADEKRAQLALVHIILSLHRAVVREFSEKYWDRLQQSWMNLPRGDAGELAAQFEIELLEDPPAARLREYWQHARALSDGILFPTQRLRDQGARELAAINGICNAHQRISGALSQTERQQREQIVGREQVRGFDAKAIDALKPLGAVFAGAAVTGTAAVATSPLWAAGILGLLTAWASSLFLKSTVTTVNKGQRNLDRVFIPDLTPRTLDRVLPALLYRLREAGLAPVLIIDELDKVEDIARRLESMIRYLKKLMAENVFSCFLTDRGYIEYLRLDHGRAAYDRPSSYFSHRLLVAYGPKEVDDYLSELLEVVDDGDAAAPLDREVLKWVLRHRSQLHALNLNRELAAIRGDDGHISLPPGDIRTDFQYRIDVTLQMAIELQLYSKEIMGWSQRQRGLQQTLFDALYYLSRSWLRGDRFVDLSATGKAAIIEELEQRMNLKEATCDETQDANSGQLQLQPANAVLGPALRPDDVLMLTTVLDGIVRFLSPQTMRHDVDALWDEVVQRLSRYSVSRPPQEVMDALLLGNQSLLKPSPVAAATTPGGSP